MHRPHTPSHVNKLIILFLLENSSMELSEFQIIRAFRELDIMMYFDLKQYLYEAERDGLIKSKNTVNGLKYEISERGLTTLSELKKEVDLTVRNKIEAYLSENKRNLENESLFAVNCIKIGEREYKVILRILDDDTVIFEVNFTVGNLKEAERAAQNWPKIAAELYKNTIGSLLSKNDESNNFDSK